MKTKFGRKLEHGQILPIVAIGIFALAGMAVLLLDVGALYVNRRTAQNAADAGALAGHVCFVKQKTQAMQLSWTKSINM